jgi:hypothetical protein
MYSYNYFHDAFHTIGDVQRHFGGFELAMLEQSASIEVVAAVNGFYGFPDVPDTAGFGDLRTTAKVVIYRNDTFVSSGGLGVGWPTGNKPAGVPAGDYYLSPFLGYLLSPQDGDWFLQAFQQLDVPTQGEDQILLHHDVGIGYWLRRDDPNRFVTGIAPTIELHLYTPLGKAPSGALADLYYDDVLNATVGTTFILRRTCSLALGVGIPITTQRDYDVEAQMHFNWNF